MHTREIPHYVGVFDGRDEHSISLSHSIPLSSKERAPHGEYVREALADAVGSVLYDIVHSAPMVLTGKRFDRRECSVEEIVSLCDVALVRRHGVSAETLSYDGKVSTELIAGVEVTVHGPSLLLPPYWSGASNGVVVFECASSFIGDVLLGSQGEVRPLTITYHDIRADPLRCRGEHV